MLWNGPAGYFENKNFLKGTLSIAENISKNTVEKSLISILGGGDTLAAINKSKKTYFFSLINSRWCIFGVLRRKRLAWS